MPHAIRLRGPWNAELFDGAGDDRTSFNYDATAGFAEHLPPSYAARVCLTRRFNRPTGIEAASTGVHLELELSHPAEVRLGDKVLGRFEPVHHVVDIKPHLAASNSLVINLDLSRGDSPPACSAKLLISE